jgi:hypothetical protein
MTKQKIDPMISAYPDTTVFLRSNGIRVSRFTRRLFSHCVFQSHVCHSDRYCFTPPKDPKYDSERGSVRQCAAVQQIAAVRQSVVESAVRQWAAVCGGVRHCERQCSILRQCVVVCAPVCVCLCQMLFVFIYIRLNLSWVRFELGYFTFD